jgi:uncharacterized protein (DUF1778 family)
MSTQSAAKRKSARLEARIPAKQKALLLRAATIKGQSLTEFVVSSAAQAATEIIRASQVLELSERDQRAFAEALLSPPRASQRLRKAARHYVEQAQ